MAAVETTKSVSIAMRLLAGTNPETGKNIIKSVALKGIQEEPDNDKVRAVITALIECFQYKSLYEVLKTTKATIDEE